MKQRNKNARNTKKPKTNKVRIGNKNKNIVWNTN